MSHSVSRSVQHQAWIQLNFLRLDISIFTSSNKTLSKSMVNLHDHKKVSFASMDFLSPLSCRVKNYVRTLEVK